MNTHTITDPSALLDERFRAAIIAAVPEFDPSRINTSITASRQPKFGDFQCNAAMGIAKRVGKQPREVAAAIVANLDVAGIASPITEADIAGPGFINITLLPEALAASLDALDSPQLGIPIPAQPKTIVVDVCGVNLAKQMHVGHLRSTVLGDAIARLNERAGHRVKRQSHVGDWGLPIAMVVEKLIELEDSGKSTDTITLDTLNTYYKSAQEKCKGEHTAHKAIIKYGSHPKALAECELRIEDADAAMKRAKSRLVALQSGDQRSVAVWQRIYDTTMTECLATCKRLNANITDEHSAGESTYRDELVGIVDDLVSRNIAEEDDGALIVRVDGIKAPCIIRKRDGGFLYATTDLAAIKRRVEKLEGDTVVYSVDSRQALHFKQVFGVARKAGYDLKSDGTQANLVHAAFGTIMGDDGKPFKSRSGGTAKLSDLLDEAVTRANASVAEKNPDMPDSERGPIAEAVAIAAIKYADLSNESIKDYVFNFDRMLAFEGDTGPYLLYALVRISSIFRKANESGIDTKGAMAAPFMLNDPAEKALALAILRYPRTLNGASEAFEPNRLCAFAYDLASSFSSFFDKCPVLHNDDAASQASRLRLCDLAGRVLRDALGTLGIPTVERM
ncbi:MAG: arginine--tRNA ligase [Phycisphaerales bacterium]|nr:arginine--tRNA ligase [Phycisphaerales bacterium]